MALRDFTSQTAALAAPAGRNIPQRDDLRAIETVGNATAPRRPGRHCGDEGRGSGLD
jgi:hypothetical protein